MKVDPMTPIINKIPDSLRSRASELTLRSKQIINSAIEKLFCPQKRLASIISVSSGNYFNWEVDNEVDNSDLVFLLSFELNSTFTTVLTTETSLFDFQSKCHKNFAIHYC